MGFRFNSKSCKDNPLTLQIYIGKIPLKTNKIRLIIFSHLIKIRMQIYIQNL